MNKNNNRFFFLLFIVCSSIGCAIFFSSDSGDNSNSNTSTTTTTTTTAGGGNSKNINRSFPSESNYYSYHANHSRVYPVPSYLFKFRDFSSSSSKRKKTSKNQKYRHVDGDENNNSSSSNNNNNNMNINNYNFIIIGYLDSFASPGMILGAKSRFCYAKRHGYRIKLFTETDLIEGGWIAKPPPPMKNQSAQNSRRKEQQYNAQKKLAKYWSKLYLINRTLHDSSLTSSSSSSTSSRNKIFVFYLDADTVIMNPQISLEEIVLRVQKYRKPFSKFRYSNKYDNNVSKTKRIMRERRRHNNADVVTSFPHLIIQNNEKVFNNGVFAMRHTSFTLRFLKRWKKYYYVQQQQMLINFGVKSTNDVLNFDLPFDFSLGTSSSTSSTSSKTKTKTTTTTNLLSSRVLYLIPNFYFDNGPFIEVLMRELCESRGLKYQGQCHSFDKLKPFAVVRLKQAAQNKLLLEQKNRTSSMMMNNNSSSSSHNNNSTTTKKTETTTLKPIAITSINQITYDDFSLCFKYYLQKYIIQNSKMSLLTRCPMINEKDVEAPYTLDRDDFYDDDGGDDHSDGNENKSASDNNSLNSSNAPPTTALQLQKQLKQKFKFYGKRWLYCWLPRDDPYIAGDARINNGLGRQFAPVSNFHPNSSLLVHFAGFRPASLRSYRMSKYASIKLENKHSNLEC